MKGCSHVLTTEESEKIRFGKAGECYQFLLNPIYKSWKGRILDAGQVNVSVSPIYFSESEIDRKVLFEVEEISDKYGRHGYRYDWVVSAVAAYIAEYNSAIFNGSNYNSKTLERLANELLMKTENFEKAKDALLLDDFPQSLSQFFLELIY